MIHLKTILHPTDFTEDSRYALEVACALARDQSARVILLHVLPHAAPIGRDRTVPTFREAHIDEDLQAYREEMTRKLAKEREMASYARVETLLHEGDVASTITRTAEETPCDVIVMGTHGNSRKHALMGGVAEEVIRKAHCPVVAVKFPVRET